MLDVRRLEGDNDNSSHCSLNGNGHGNGHGHGHGHGHGEEEEEDHTPLMEGTSGGSEVLPVSVPGPVPEVEKSGGDVVLSDEYESAVYVGNDMTIDGEKALNGFSARGWNPIMATMALRRAVDTLE